MDTKQQLVNALVGLGSTITEAMDVIEGFVPCGHPALVVTGALNALTDGADEATLAEHVETVRGFIDHVSENRGVTAHHDIELGELTGAKAELFAAISAIASPKPLASRTPRSTNGSTAASLPSINPIPQQ